MRAELNGRLLAESDSVLTVDDYVYFPPDTVRTAHLSKSPRNESDLACPHGVQFYDVHLDSSVHERAAWSYETPRPSMQAVKGFFGFWNDVQVG